ncbi:MAG: flagellar hook-associated family protein [Hyphomicrobiaceae bacterium]
MKSTFISTSALSEATRLSLMKAQAKLAQAQKEVTTGRYADVGQSLGYKTGQTVSLRQELSRLTAIQGTNAEVGTRLDMTQAAIKQMVDGAQSFLSQLIGARENDNGPTIIQSQAQGNLTAMTDALNTTFDGAYIFSGINADVKPVGDYFQSPAGAARTAVASAFSTAFGVTQSDPGAQSISAGDMQTFLDGAFSSLFDASSWSGTWSAASDQNVRSRISTTELVETSTNANEEAFRKLASAYTMVADLGVQNLSKETYQAVVDKASKVIGEAIQSLSNVQATIGNVQERVSNANDKMAAQLDIMKTHITALEAVDPYEASTRVSGLMTQIETAYALTGRIQGLSLLNYL